MATPTGTGLPSGITHALSFSGSNSLTIPGFVFGTKDFSIDWWECRSYTGNYRATFGLDIQSAPSGYTPIA
ncbi:MAG: hypothetical protein AB7D47_13460, partial [Desulfovibrio sp.]